MNAENLSPDHVIRRVAVIGTGTLGAQIAVMTAASGRDVQLYDAVPGAAEHAFLRVRSMLEGPIANGELAWDLDTVLNRMTVAPSLADAVKDVDLVIEAVREDLATKREVFAEISRHNPA